MARNVDPVAHQARRDRFLDAAERLLRQKGFDAMSIGEVIAEAGASKGAFYHYFDSKLDLLEAMMRRTAAQTAAHLAKVAAEGGDDPLARLQRVFDALAQWKTERRELLVKMLEVWQADANAVARLATRTAIADGVGPTLAEVIADGTERGRFTAADPDESGRLVVHLIQDLNDRLGDLVLGGEASLEDGMRAVAAYTSAVERVIGVSEGAIVLVAPATLRPWFTPPDP